MPARPDLQLSTEQPCDVRRPRFHEDFDAPFSEALLSPALLSPALLSPAPPSPAFTATTSCASSPSSEHPGDMSLHVRVNHASRPSQSRGLSWSSAHDRSRDASRGTGRRSRSRSSNRSTGGAGVNDKIRDWARRSFLPSRRPDDGQPSRCP
ncbi:hypothetical protein E4U53_005824 [Claviceps sorghi]|nr:hypothetical protein E4U53_005824 [Claviceps sorghi]